MDPRCVTGPGAPEQTSDLSLEEETECPEETRQAPQPWNRDGDRNAQDEMRAEVVEGAPDRSIGKSGPQLGRLRRAHPVLSLPAGDAPVQETLGGPVGTVKRIGQVHDRALLVEQPVQRPDDVTPKTRLRCLPREDRFFAPVHRRPELGQSFLPEAYPQL